MLKGRLFIGGLVALTALVIVWTNYFHHTTDRAQSAGNPVDEIVIPIQLPPEKKPASSLVNNSPTQISTYFRYNPHSGLNNQRIALINAFVIAKALNRTLILPRMLLYVIDHQVFDILLKHTQESWRCPYRNILCTQSWNCFYSRQRLDALGVPFVDRHEAPAFSNVLYLKDERRYDYAWINDSCVDCLHVPPSKFGRVVNAAELRQMPQPPDLIWTGSLHGSTLLSGTQWDTEFVARVRRAFIYDHPTTLAIAAQVVALLGGQRKYWAVHLRLGNGFFKENAMATVSGAVSQLRALLLKSGSSLPPFLLLTDIRIPRNESVLHPFFAHFNHTTRLFSEFAELLQPLAALEPSCSFPSMAAAVEQVVAAKAQRFVGTPSSTFSAYISFMHKLNEPHLPQC